MSRCPVMYRQNTCIFHEIIPSRIVVKIVQIHYLMEAERVLSRITRGGRKNNGPAFSAGQWPSLAWKAEKKCAPLLIAIMAVSFLIFSSSPTFTRGIVCLKFFSLKYCRFYFSRKKRGLVKKEKVPKKLKAN